MLKPTGVQKASSPLLASRVKPLSRLVHALRAEGQNLARDGLDPEPANAAARLLEDYVDELVGRM